MNKETKAIPKTETEAEVIPEAIMQRYFDYIKGKPVSIGVKRQGFAVHSESTR